ncbi:MAG: Asp-tRNA(Asn)/Glu-tRNA(Gln) amidotransferase subunit GatB [Nanoarchaeota archaeon]|nr:Asp-tRNA(Asn)/Glu-tRNA(Gln) amidotransferase subunit GatB [Nanoarchaeota archaeon]
MVKIGLEIHGYLETKEKLFCSCVAEHGAKFSKPNTNICPICTGQPGSKPMLPNAAAIDKAIQIALILNCKINEKLIWQRKHYSWPDLPKGYQNTLSGPHAFPIGINGKFEGIKITEVHLEEDPAAWNPKTGEIDYNRSGSPLIEIVTEPDFTSSSQVVEWLITLKSTLSYIKALDRSSGLKADVNVSISGGARVEIKNVNSISNIKTAIEHELARQERSLPKKQETRAFNELDNTTTHMRFKEEAEDYRFISDPDLPIIKIDSKTIKRIKENLPETPKEKLNKLIKKYKIPKDSTEVLTKNLDMVELFEIVSSRISPQLALNWITIELQRVLNYNKKLLDEVEIIPEHIIELLELVQTKKITELKAKEILNKFVPKSFSPLSEATKNATISDEKEIEKIALKVISENKKAVNDYKAGEEKAINFLIGQVMRISNKRADFATAKRILEKNLK